MPPPAQSRPLLSPLGKMTSAARRGLVIFWLYVSASLIVGSTGANKLMASSEGSLVAVAVQLAGYLKVTVLSLYVFQPVYTVFAAVLAVVLAAVVLLL